MPIQLDKTNNKTICTCDQCGIVVDTDAANGVVPEHWGTGQLWIDVSLSSIKQTAICFCPTCFERVKSATKNLIVSEI
jgi:hypothetical protein